MTSKVVPLEGVVGLVGVVAGVLVGSPTVVCLALPSVLFVRRLRRLHVCRQRKRLQSEALGVLIDVMGQQVRSGASLHGAVMSAIEDPSVVALEGELTVVASAVNGGQSLESALFELGDRTDLVELSLLATSVGVLVAHGGPVAPAIERLGELVRSIEVARLDAQSHASQATASAVVMAALPVVFAVVVALIDRRMAAFYVQSTLGAVCVVIAAGLAAMGWLWMDRLIWGPS